MTALLELDGVGKRYGALQAVDGLRLRLAAGQATGVVGPNGAGKTTMFHLIAGSVRADAGRIVFDGRDVTRLRPDRRCRAGIARTYQVPRPFSGMSAFENVLVAALHAGHPSEGEACRASVDALERSGLLGQANRRAGSLTLLERKRLELARALAARPRLLLLDEIAGGLTEAEVRGLVATVLRLRSEGMTILWIEHVVHALVSAVDRLLVLGGGRAVLEGEPRDVMASAQVQELYMGVVA